MRTPIHCLEEADKRSIRIIDIKRTFGEEPFFAQITYTRRYTGAYKVHCFDQQELNFWIEKQCPEAEKVLKEGAPFDDLDSVILSCIKKNFEITKITVLNTFFDCDIDGYKYLTAGQPDAIEFIFRPLSIEQKYYGITDEHFCAITLDIYYFGINEIKSFGVRDMFAYYQFPAENQKITDVRIQYKYKESTIEYLKTMMKKYFDEDN